MSTDGACRVQAAHVSSARVPGRNPTRAAAAGIDDCGHAPGGESEEGAKVATHASIPVEVVDEPRPPEKPGGMDWVHFLTESLRNQGMSAKLSP